MKRLIALVFWAGLIGAALLLSVSAPMSDRSVRLLFMGDVMLGRDIGRRHAAESSWQSVFSVLKTQFDQSDLVLLNMESPVCQTNACEKTLQQQWQGNEPANDKATAMNLCTTRTSLKAFVGFPRTILNLANNHRNDCAAYEDVESGCLTCGDNRLWVLSDGQQPLWFEKDDIRIAILSGDDVSHELDADRLLSAVRKANKQADWVIVSIHWGSEYQPVVSGQQKKLAHQLVETGADIVWGHHAHVWQGMEFLERAGQQPALILYGLGNTMFDQAYPKPVRAAHIVEISITKQEIQPAVVINCFINPVNGVLTYCTTN